MKLLLKCSSNFVRPILASFKSFSHGTGDSDLKIQIICSLKNRNLLVQS